MINPNRATGISRMSEIIGELDGDLNACYTNISGTATAVGFGRGGMTRDIRILPYSHKPLNISGTATGVCVGRGGVPKGIRYVSYREQKNEGDRKCADDNYRGRQ
jgi:hypothetical protein